VALPTLVIVSGPPGSGKTTLAHRLAGALGCPAVCRDEIKQGMARATPGFVPAPGDPLTRRTYATFFAVLELLVGAGVTVVAEAAFQDRLWRAGLEPLAGQAELRIVQCIVEPAVARARIARRLAADAPGRAAHADQDLLRELAGGTRAVERFVPIALAARTIRVDTTDGYRPGLPALVAFVDQARADR
jgi:predicted kinase